MSPRMEADDGEGTEACDRDGRVRVKVVSVVRLQLLALCAAVSFGCGEHAGEEPEPQARLNVLLVTVDTLRADHLGCYGSVLGLTPNIDALAARGLRFGATYSPAPFTLPAVGALMTGRYPEALGLSNNLSRIPVGTTTLAVRARDAGYTTAAVVSNPVLSPRSRLDDGFDTYDADIREPEASRSAVERGATATTDAAIAMLAQLDAAGAGQLDSNAARPFFLWVHYQDPHGPYTPPDGMREQYLAAARAAPDGQRKLRKLDGWRGQGGIPAYQYIPRKRDAGWYRAGYAAEIRHVDEELGRLVDTLGRSGVLAQTLVVFTADHGEALGERDYWFAHGEHLDDAAVRVPLLFAGPGVESDVRSETVSLIDVFATLSSVFGLPPGADGAGIDLLAHDSVDADRAVYTSTNKAAASHVKRAIVSAGFKLVRESGPEGPREALYRLPDEQADLASALTEQRLALSQRLDALTPRLERRAAPLAPTDRERDALEALGYVVGGADTWEQQ
jgi:arylsulfatase A-like enzyme